MALFQQMVKIKDRVREILIRHPHLRDDDHKLVASYHKFEIGDTIKDMSAVQLLKMYAENRLTNSDAITRVRRKLQETEPETRGSKYLERHRDAEEVRTSINNL